MKKASLIILFVLILSMVFSGCTSPTATSQAPVATTAPVESTAIQPTKSAVTHMVRYVDWGFSGDLQVPFQKYLADPFAAKHPDVAVTLLGGITEDALNQIKAAHGASPIDSIMMGESRYIDAINEDILAPMTVNEVPNIALIDPETQKSCEGYGAAWMNQIIGVAYDKTKVSAPKSWSDLWNPEYKGKIGIPSPAANNGFLFLVMIAKLNGGDESNMDVAFQKLDELAPFTVAANPGALATMLENGEIDLMVNWQTQSGPTLAKNPNFDFVIPEPGGAALTSCYTVLNASANKDLAYEYINDALSTEFQTEISSPPWYFGPTNVNVQVPAESSKLVPSMSEIKSLVKVDWNIANKSRTELTDKFLKRYGQ